MLALMQAMPAACRFGSRGRQMKQAVARSLSSRFVRRPIFQVGASRSGTIVLYKALGRHPAILAMPGENPLVDPLAGLAASFESGDEAWYFRESVRLDPPRLYAKLRDLIFETTGGPHMGFRTLAKALARDPLGFAAKRHWCVKCFPLEASARALCALYPEARFVYIVRNGVDVVQSRTKFPVFSGQPFEQHCEFWVQAARKFDYLRQWDRCIEVRQEQLLSEPEAVFARICRHLGTDDHPAPAEYVRTTLVHSRGDVSTQVGVDVRKSLTERAPSHETWTAEQRETFRRICGPDMERLGYAMPF
jgi:hypothetical protein